MINCRFFSQVNYKYLPWRFIANNHLHPKLYCIRAPTLFQLLLPSVFGSLRMVILFATRNSPKLEVVSSFAVPATFIRSWNMCITDRFEILNKIYNFL